MESISIFSRRGVRLALYLAAAFLVGICASLLVAYAMLGSVQSPAPNDEQISTQMAQEFAYDLATHLVGLPRSSVVVQLTKDPSDTVSPARCQFVLKNGNQVETLSSDYKTACAQAALSLMNICLKGGC